MKIFNIFKNKPEKIKKEKIDLDIKLYEFNWFVHVLAENVGKVTWRRKTKEERCNPILCRDYPYMAVEHPIPEGKDIILKDSETYTIKCDSEFTRNLIIKLAKEYIVLEKENRYLHRESSSENWIPIEVLRPHSTCSSRRDFYEALVTSPELAFIGGTHMGYRRDGKWYALIGKEYIEHKVTHYRNLPPSLNFDIPYENMKDEVERLRSLRDYKKL